MNRKAQSAFEFLMTYGWAILIMLVVLGIIFYLGIFNPQSAAPKSCILPAGFSCYEYLIDKDGNLHLDLGQAQGRTITITGIACSTSSDAILTPTNVTIETGQHAVVTGSGLPCEGATSDVYRGKVIFTYVLRGSSITHKVVGDISGPLEGTTGGGGGGW